MNITASEITPKKVSLAIELGPRLKKRGGSEGSDVTLPCIQPSACNELSADAHPLEAQAKGIHAVNL